MQSLLLPRRKPFSSSPAPPEPPAPPPPPPGGRPGFEKFYPRGRPRRGDKRSAADASKEGGNKAAEAGEGFGGGGGNNSNNSSEAPSTLAAVWRQVVQLGALAAVVAGVSRLTDPTPEVQEISFAWFKHHLLARGLVDRLEVSNKAQVKVFVRGNGFAAGSASAASGAVDIYSEDGMSPEGGPPAPPAGRASSSTDLGELARRSPTHSQPRLDDAGFPLPPAIERARAPGGAGGAGGASRAQASSSSRGTAAAAAARPPPPAPPRPAPPPPPPAPPPPLPGSTATPST